MNKDDLGVHPRSLLKWAQKDEYTFTFHSGPKIKSLLYRTQPIVSILWKWKFGHGRQEPWADVGKGLCFRFLREQAGKLCYLCDGLLSLSGHAPAAAALQPCKPLGGGGALPIPSPCPGSPWLGSWLIQGNPGRLTLDLMAPVGSWEIAGNLSPCFFFNIGTFSKATNKRLFLKPAFKIHWLQYSILTWLYPPKHNNYFSSISANKLQTHNVKNITTIIASASQSVSGTPCLFLAPFGENSLSSTNGKI